MTIKLGSAPGPERAATRGSAAASGRAVVGVAPRDAIVPVEDSITRRVQGAIPSLTIREPADCAVAGLAEQARAPPPGRRRRLDQVLRDVARSQRPAQAGAMGEYQTHPAPAKFLVIAARECRLALSGARHVL